MSIEFLPYLKQFIILGYLITITWCTYYYNIFKVMIYSYMLFINHKGII